MTTHTQCKLSKNGFTYHAWIPTDLAKVGNLVSLKEDKGDEWLKNWVVDATFTTMDSKTVQERSQDYKKTRKASDI